MIETTDEMVQLIYERIDFQQHGDDGIREGLAAVLAVVERDYRMVRICGAQLGTSMRCERAEHDEGDHEAIAPGGSLVRWL